MQKIRNSKGFTLIELMIVVVIIGILAAIALPKFSGMSRSAKEAEADPLLKEVYTLQQAYYTRFNMYADAGTLAKHGFDANLSSEDAANKQKRYYFIKMEANTSPGAAATFCALANPTSDYGVKSDLQAKNMGQNRVITPGAGQTTANCI